LICNEDTLQEIYEILNMEKRAWLNFEYVMTAKAFLRFRKALKIMLKTILQNISFAHIVLASGII
jgi:hypothetical protein